MSDTKFDEFEGKSFKECAQIIVGNPDDRDWTDRQITALVEQHERLIREAYKKGYTDKGIAELIAHENDKGRQI